MGVSQCWLVDPMRCICFSYDAHDLHFIESNTLTIPETSVAVDLDPLFAQLDAVSL